MTEILRNLFSGLIIEEEPLLFVYLIGVSTGLCALVYLAAYLLVLSIRHAAHSETSVGRKGN